MPVRLLIHQANVDQPPQELKLDGDELVIGRDKSCQVMLADPGISRNHARITRDGNLYFLEDSGSAYGTRLSGVVMPKGDKRRLKNNDVIAIGTFDLTFQIVLDMGSGEDGVEKTTALAKAAVKGLLRDLSSDQAPYLRVMNGPLDGRRFDVGDAREVVIGRQEDCEIVIDDDLASRKHARVRRDWSGTHVEDLGSRNGVKVNRKAIKQQTTLNDGDEVEVGGTRFLYVDPSAAADPLTSGLGVIPGLSDELPRKSGAAPRGSLKRGEQTLSPQLVDLPKIEAPPPPVEEPEEHTNADAPPDFREPEPEPEPEQLVEPTPSMAYEVPEDELQPPGNDLRSRAMAFLPQDRDQLRRLAPLLVAGAVVLVGLIVLVIVFATS